MAYGGAAGQISSLQISRFVTSGQRMSVPVRPSQTVFTQYRYVSGTPAGHGQNAVPITKVHLLNSLISNLQRIQSRPDYQPLTTEPTAERADAMIRQYSRELHQAVKARPQPFGTMGGVSGSGMVFATSA